jgi:hypothetical protein
MDIRQANAQSLARDTGCWHPAALSWIHFSSVDENAQTFAPDSCLANSEEVAQSPGNQRLSTIAAERIKPCSETRMCLVGIPNALIANFIYSLTAIRVARKCSCYKGLLKGMGDELNES